LLSPQLVNLFVAFIGGLRPKPADKNLVFVSIIVPEVSDSALVLVKLSGKTLAVMKFRNPHVNFALIQLLRMILLAYLHSLREFL
jgi:hypothetical protein